MFHSRHMYIGDVAALDSVERSIVNIVNIDFCK